MLRRPLTWCVLSLLLCAGALVFWRSGNRPAAQPAAASAERLQRQARALDATPRALRQAEPWRLLSTSANAASPFAAPLRLSNATFTPEQWLRRPTAVLLENALIDTAVASPPPIPAHLRAPGDPGTYIVQARGRIDEAFRAVLRQAGAEVVAYIPNNAYLVRAGAETAQQLTGRRRVQAVLAYEPYYKLKDELLRQAVARNDLGLGERLNVALFADAREATLAALADLGAEMLAEERSPFGPVVTVRPRVDSLVAMAALPGVQVIETASDRVPANDLGRARMGISPDSVAAETWLGLSGSNVLINVNDSAVDALHPDLVGRMFALFDSELSDPNGHGTHVIGTIAGSGVMSDTVTNASGSEMPGTNGQFRGAAPAAKVFVMPVFQALRPGRADASPVWPDSVLQEAAARTNALISNNSWHYGGNQGYNLAATRYDAATRDALPGQPGSQPLLFVFAAGNAGNGNGHGKGGRADSIRSPGTAKNVITVGAVEQKREITNEVWRCEPCDSCTNANGLTCTTNAPWELETDRDDQVAAYSGRGNTGVGIERGSGRFKPDVVAPGAWVVSTRSTNWDQAAYYNPTNSYSDLYTDLKVETEVLNAYSIWVPYNAVQVYIDLEANADSPVPFPNLPIYVKQSDIATTNDYDFIVTNHVALPPDNGPNLTPRDTAWNFSVGNNTTGAVAFNLRTTVLTTNDNGNLYEVHSNLNNTLGPWYRYESGTSMAAAHVAGMLALMQEFFEQRLGRTNSPALMKALLINGARSLDSTVYDFQTRTLHNYQGWGLANLPTTLPPPLTNYNTQRSGPMFFADQNPTNALATGDRHTRTLTVSDAGRLLDLRVTLVWTDPPGNPAAGVKLVNDLDLVVTNLDTGEVFFGNDIPSGSEINEPWQTNDAPDWDVVNNVENVYLRAGSAPLSTNYSITVLGSRVNVNAVTAHTNDTVQDYALVVSSGDGELPDALTLTAVAGLNTGQPYLSQPTNTFSPDVTPGYTGTLLLGQHVGANTPLMGITNGMTNQWHFYVLTNTESFTNAAFVTFLPYTLSIPRLGVNEAKLANATRVQADIDLYVSLNAGLTNLDPNVIDLCAQNVSSSYSSSRGRGGTEVIIYSNAAPGGVYYIGVKAEDQMAAEYGFLGVFSLLPFDEGDNVLRGFPAPVTVPDGTPDAPGAGFMFAVRANPIQVRRVVVTNTVTHEDFGDLVGTLSHDGIFATFNNHTFPPGDPPPLTYTKIYEDNGEGDIIGAERTDGPGSLRDFVGAEGAGLWVWQMTDDAANHTGRLDRLSIRLDPTLIHDDDIWRAVQPGKFIYDFVDVPATATNLTVCVYATNQPVELYIRRGAFPTRSKYDKMLTIQPPGDCLTLDLADLPPLTAGRYYIGVYNPNTTIQYVRIVVTIELDPRAIAPVLYTEIGTTPLLDDAVTYATQFVTNTARIATADVGLRIDHPRVSDLAVTLISPRGTRILLTEARGWTNDAGFGSSYTITNIVPQDSSGGPAAYTNVLDTGVSYGSVTIDYEFWGIPDRLKVYYEGTVIYDTGMVSGGDVVSVSFGPGVSTMVTITMNEGGNPSPDTLWEYTASSIQTIHNYLMFTESTHLTATPIKFAPPPFTPPTNKTIQLISGFEPAAAGDYLAPQTFDGWTAQTTNPVTVVDDVATAHTGSKYLALRAGEILRTLPTTMGRNYRVDFAYRAAPAMDGLIGWWRGEGNASDSVYGNNGSIQNVSFATGAVGQAFAFRGYNSAPHSQVSVKDQPIYQLTNSLTIEGWIKPAGTGGNPGVILWRGDCRGGYDPYFLLMNPDDTLGFYIEDESGGPATSVSTPAPLALNQWSHVAATLDGNLGIMCVYLNGVLAAQTSTSMRPFGALIPSQEPTIGIGNAGTACWDYLPFNGELDEISLYSRALTSAEVNGIHAAGAAGKCGMAVRPAVCAWGNRPHLSGIISWWPGESNCTDIVDGNNGVFAGNANYSGGQVGQGFVFDGNRDGVNIGTAPNLQLQDFSIEAWIRRASTATASFNGNGNGTIFALGGGGGGYGFWIDQRAATRNRLMLGKSQVNEVWSAAQVADTNWHHVAVTKQGTTVVFYVDGVAYPAPAYNSGGFSFTVPGYIGAWYNPFGQVDNSFYGAIDDLAVFNRALTAAEVLEIYTVGAAGKCGMAAPPLVCSPLAGAQAFVPGVITNSFAGTDVWQTNSLSFTASGNGTLFGVSPLNGDSGTWLDTFVLTEFPGPMYVLPEESLKALADEYAYGTWTLEILDTRTGGTNTIPPELISWQLRFVYQNDIPIPASLVPGEPKTNTIPAGYISYYIVDVPSWATFATNSLLTATGPLNVWFNQYTPPFGTNAGDYLLLNQVTSGIEVLSGATTPPLQSGRRYYLGIQNTNSTAVTYAFQVDFDITALADGVPVIGLIEPDPLPRYFSYDVSSNATAVRFALTDLSGNVQLVARRGSPPPTLASYDYGSFNGGIADEEIVVLTNSLPVALAPGRWYLGVFNVDVATVLYTIIAEEFVLTTPIITLTNGIPYFGTAAANGLDYYRYVVTPNGVRAQFEINGPSGDLTLVARRGWPPPDPVSFDYRSANPGTNDELIVVFDTSSPVPLAAGDWYLTAANLMGSPSSYAIMATEWPVAGQPITITGVGVTSTNFCLTWTSLPGAHYFVEGLTDLDSTTWVTVSPTLTATDVLTTWCLPLPSPYHFFRVVEGVVVAP